MANKKEKRISISNDPGQEKQTPKQITESICRHTGNMILEAGAGTGKTHNLTERVIYQLIYRNIPLEEMLALTFTDFAAAEMRSRIFLELNKKLNECIKNDKNDDTIIYLRNARRLFSRNYISTFHSFCNRILQYFPEEITEISVYDRPVLTPGKNIDKKSKSIGVKKDRVYSKVSDSTKKGASDKGIGDNDFEEEEIKQRNIDGSYELLSDYDEVLLMLDWRKRFYQKYKGHKGLKRQLSRLSVLDFEQFMQKLSVQDEKVLHTLSTLTPGQYLQKLRNMKKIKEEETGALTKELLGLFASHPEWFKSEEKRPRSFNEMYSHKIQTGFSKKIFNIEEIGGERLKEVNEKGTILFAEMEELSSINHYLALPQIEESILNYPLEEDFDSNHEAYWNTRDLAELAWRWGTLMRYQRFEAGFFNYDDMIWLTYTLFKEKPQVVTQMRRRFKQILIDEFQDTDFRQWEIIRKLALPLPNHPQNRQDSFISGRDTPVKETPPDASAPSSLFDSPQSKKTEKESALSSNKENKELLIVGDVKQAIYAFRGGDVTMMKRAHKELMGDKGESGTKKITLPFSFRSNQAIISFSNYIFRHILDSEASAAIYEAHHMPLRTPSDKNAGNASADGEVRIFIANGSELFEDDKNKQGQQSQAPSIEAEHLANDPVHLEARWIARFLRIIYDGEEPRYQKITEKMQAGEKAVGVLYRRRNHIYALEQALRAEGLPYTVAKGTRYYQRREIKDAWLLLSFLLDAYDNLSLTGLLRSPMVSLSDSALLAIRIEMDKDPKAYPCYWNAICAFEKWGSPLPPHDYIALKHGIRLLKNLRARVPSRTVSEILEQAFFIDGPYLAAFGEDPQVRENLIKLLDIIRHLEKTGRGTLFEITRFLSKCIREEAQDKEAEPPEPASIQIMTIHGSKGLQFPMVVIPDLYSGIHEGGIQLYIAEPETIGSDEPSPADLFPAISYQARDKESSGDDGSSFIHNHLKKQNTKRQIAEAKRLFYVAVTRAETHLALSLVRPKVVRSKGSFAGMIEPLLTKPDDEPPVTKSTSNETISKYAQFDYLDAGKLENLLEKRVPANQEESEKKVGGDKKRDTRKFAEMEENRGASALSEEHFAEPDRESKIFQEAEERVSLRIRSASGARLTKEVIHDEDIGLWRPEAGDEVLQQEAGKHPVSHHGVAGGAELEKRKKADEVDSDEWDGISPAEAGTLIHRALEMGIASESSNKKNVVAFLLRELMKMNKKDPERLAADNAPLIMHHCRNAEKWLNFHFGEDARKRFETAFEFSIPEKVMDELNVEIGSSIEALSAQGGDAPIKSQVDSDFNNKENPEKEKRVTIRGYIDLIICDKEGNDHIVDFKTGGGWAATPESGKAAGDRVEIQGEEEEKKYAGEPGYIEQLNLYKKAYENICRKKLANERVWLLYTAGKEGRGFSLADLKKP